MKPEKLEEKLLALYQSQELSETFENGWRAAIQREEQQRMEKKRRKWNWSLFWKIAVPVVCTLVLIIGTLTVSDFTINKTTVDSGYDSEANGYSADLAASPMKASRDTSAAKSSVTYDAVMESAEEWAADTVDYDYGASSGEAVAGAGVAYDNTVERKLIRSVNMTIRTTVYDDDYAALQALLKEVGGYVEYQSRSGDGKNGNTRRTYLTLRVPSNRLDDFLAGSSQIGRVTELTESTEDQTTAFYDNETRLKTLRSKLERLNQLMLEAGDLSDLLEVENAISDTQYRIDSYETAQRLIQSRVDMSEVSVELREETVRERVEPKEYTLGERLAAALESGWEGFVAFLGNLLVFLTLALPVLVVAAVVITALVLMRRRKKARKSNENSDE